jgi:hypothetical protein
MSFHPIPNYPVASSAPTYPVPNSTPPYPVPNSTPPYPVPNSVPPYPVAHSIRILSGTDKADFYAGENENAYMHTGSGERSYYKNVIFSERFNAPPKVMIAIQGYDAASSQVSSIRLTVEALDITETGFKIHYKTWWDSKIYGVWASWIAIGA